MGGFNMNIKILSTLCCILLFIPVFSIIAVADENNPPNPPVIEGPTSGKIRERYTYNFTVTDPDEDDRLLKLEIDWGDETQTETCGCDVPWYNGEIIQLEHTWKKTGNYEIKARVADVYNNWSEWSEPFSTSMPKSKMLTRIANPLLPMFLEHFPFLEKIFFMIKEIDEK